MLGNAVGKLDATFLELSHGCVKVINLKRDNGPPVAGG